MIFEAIESFAKARRSLERPSVLVGGERVAEAFASGLSDGDRQDLLDYYGLVKPIRRRVKKSALSAETQAVIKQLEPIVGDWRAPFFVRLAA